MRALLTALLLVSFFPLHAAEKRTYAVLSLIGDRLMIATRDLSTGSRLDQNVRNYVELSSPAIDNTTVLAMESAVKRAEPATEVVLLAARDPAIFAAQARMLEKDSGTEALLPAIRQVLAGAQASHLLLATKVRHAAMLRLDEGHVGSGWLEGVGFYVDRTMRVTNRATREASTGFLAPFAYFRIALVDLATGKVVRERNVIASMTHGRQESSHPWDTMSSEEKIQALEEIIRRETARAVPELIK